MNHKLPYENRMAVEHQNRMQRVYRGRPSMQGETANLHTSSTPQVHQIKQRYRLLAQAIDQDLPASLRAAKKRQLDIEMVIELDSLKSIINER